MYIIIVCIILLIILFLNFNKKESITNRDYLGEVLLLQKPEYKRIDKDVIIYSGGPPSFKFSDNIISTL